MDSVANSTLLDLEANTGAGGPVRHKLSASNKFPQYSSSYLVAGAFLRHHVFFYYVKSTFIFICFQKFPPFFISCALDTAVTASLVSLLFTLLYSSKIRPQKVISNMCLVFYSSLF